MSGPVLEQESKFRRFMGWLSKLIISIEYKDTFFALIFLGIVFGRMLWPNILLVDKYTFIFLSCAALFFYKKGVVEFLSSGKVRKFKVGKDGLSFELAKGIEDLYKKTQDMTGGKPMEATELGPSKISRGPMRNKVSGKRKKQFSYLAQPEEHVVHIQQLAISIDNLKKALGADPADLLSEAIAVASIEKRIDVKEKELLYKFNELIAIITQVPQFVYTGQLIALERVADRLAEKIKGDVTTPLKPKVP